MRTNQDQWGCTSSTERSPHLGMPLLSSFQTADWCIYLQKRDVWVRIKRMQCSGGISHVAIDPRVAAPLRLPSGLTTWQSFRA